MKILYPLYNYPTHWDPPNYIWDDVAAAQSQVPITAIINPSNGPGSGGPNADYVIGLNALRTAGVTILGYVYTDWGNRSAVTVKAEIDEYNDHFNIDGIFFDQVATTKDKVCYYRDLYDYVNAQANLDTVVINPGTNTTKENFTLPTCDTGVIFENVSAEWPPHVVDRYVGKRSADEFSMMVHGVADEATMKYHIDVAASRNIGHVFITDDVLPNPYDALPTYWQAMVDYIEDLNA